MADAPTPTPAPGTPPAPAATPAATPPAAAPAPGGLDPAVILDRAAKADARAYQMEQAAKSASAELATLKAQAESIKKDPWSYLKGQGVTEQMVLERAAVGQPAASEEVLQLRQELADMKSWRERVEQERKQTDERVQIGGLAGQARQFLVASQDQDVLAALAFADALAGGQADFSAKIKTYQEQAKKSGVDLTAEQAAGMLKPELVGMKRSFVENKALADAFDRMLGRAAGSETPPSPGGQPATPGQTLTSGMAQGGSGGSPPDFSKMTEDQERAYWAQVYPGQIPPRR